MLKKNCCGPTSNTTARFRCKCSAASSSPFALATTSGQASQQEKKYLKDSKGIMGSLPWRLCLQTVLPSSVSSQPLQWPACNGQPLAKCWLCLSGVLMGEPAWKDSGPKRSTCSSSIMSDQASQWCFAQLWPDLRLSIT